MNRKHVSLLAGALAVVIGAIALLTPTRTSREGVAEPAAFLAGLDDRINEATALSVVVAGDETVARLAVRDEGWVITDLHDYPADWERVRDVLAGIAQARIIESKTANPDYFERLGVEDIDDESAAGVLLRVEFAAGEPVGVIVGNTAGNRDGRYLRALGDTQSVLADFDAEVPRDAIGWADAAVVDIAADDVAEVRIDHPDGETLRVWKASADDADFVLDGGLPEGRELRSTWAMNGLGGVLATVRMEDVRPADTLDWQGATTVEVLTFSGLQLRAELVQADDSDWLRLGAEAPFDAEAGVAGESATGEGGTDVQATDAAADAATEAAARADELNQRFRGWAYRISDYKAEAMNKRLEDLLKPLDADDGDAG